MVDCIVQSIPGNSISGTVTGTFTPSGLQNAGRMTEVTIDDTNWTALPPTALNDRNGISIQNQSIFEMKIHYDNTTVGYKGTKIPADGERFYDIKDTIIIYGKLAPGSGSAVILVEELS